jgi:putative tributyrin esterase
MDNHFPLGMVELSDPQHELAGMRTLTVRSQSLQCRLDVTVHAPQEVDRFSDVPVVVLLHGVYGSHWSWFLQGGAHTTARRLTDAGRIRPFVLASPADGYSGDGTAYIDQAGRGFERWISSELPCMLRTVFPCIGQAAPVFLAGLSMGGYGAIRIGAKYPERFQGISAHSAITELTQMSRFLTLPFPFDTIDAHDASILRWCCQHRDRLPPLRFDCANRDLQLESNRALHLRMEELSIPHAYFEFEGEHSWSYWSRHLEDTLLFFEAILKTRDGSSLLHPPALREDPS